jgi:hypothetical protein
VLQSRYARHLLLIEVDCLAVLPHSCSHPSAAAGSCQEDTGNFQVARQQSWQQQQQRQASPFCLVSSRQVLSALFSSFGPLLPAAHDVPKAQLLLALEAIWAGVAAAVQHLGQQGHLPPSCCFDIRHFRRTLQSLIAVLSEHIAQQDSNKQLLSQAAAAAAAAEAAAPPVEPAAACSVTPQTPMSTKSPFGPSLAAQKSSGSIWSAPAGTPKTPNSPAAAAAAAALTPLTPATPSAAAAAVLPYSPSAWRLSNTAPGTPGAASSSTQQPAAAAAAGLGVSRGIGGRKVPLKAMCCAVLEVLCR